MSDEIEVTVILPNEQTALALAQFVKRVGFAEFEQNAANEEEAYLMRDGVSKVQDALSEVGYNPR